MIKAKVIGIISTMYPYMFIDTKDNTVIGYGNTTTEIEWDTKGNELISHIIVDPIEINETVWD